MHAPATLRTLTPTLLGIGSSSTATSTSVARLSRKAVLEISGPDARKFLKGQSCKDVEALGGGYSGFLNASGRVIHTVFIFILSPSRYLITYDTHHPSPLSTLLPPFRLRSKVRFADVSAQWDAWAAWGGDAVPSPAPERVWKPGSGGAVERQWTWPGAEGVPSCPLEGRGEGGGVGAWDLRAGWAFGRQLLLPKGSTHIADTPAPGTIVSEDAYHLRRTLLGVPEGPEEIVPGAALPLESCMDVHGGVDFRKGCYLGQELTVRTYHTGATRKRILPLRFFPLGDKEARVDGHVHVDANLEAYADSSSSSTPSSAPDPSSSLTAAPLDLVFHPGPSATSQRPKSAGRVLSRLSHPNPAVHVGLGLVRVEMADKSWWSRVSTSAGVGHGGGNGNGGGSTTSTATAPMTVGEWLAGAHIRTNIAGEEYGVHVGQGEAYGAAMREAYPSSSSIDA